MSTMQRRDSEDILDQRPATTNGTDGASSNAPRRPSVLLVDDDKHNLKAVTEILSDLDAELVCASSGKEALRLILERDFAAILLDIRMPGIDGYETATLIRQQIGRAHV